MTWIKTIPYEKASGPLKRLFDRVKGPNNYIDNILLAHGLRPPSLAGHMALYKNVLHHKDNSLPKWLLEALGTYVSHLNACDYCYQHHFTGMKRLLDDDEKANAIKAAISNNRPEDYFEGQALALMRYAYALTLEPAAVQEKQIQTLRHHGLDDGAILEANQVISYFAYANRTVLGLGVNTNGEVLGLSPSDMDDEGNWQHQ
ncbi:MAG: peroxidase-related enzyme [Bacteroidota bacterium]